MGGRGNRLYGDKVNVVILRGRNVCMCPVKRRERSLSRESGGQFPSEMARKSQWYSGENGQRRRSRRITEQKQYFAVAALYKGKETKRRRSSPGNRLATEKSSLLLPVVCVPWASEW